MPGEPVKTGQRIFHLPQPVLDLPAKTCQTRMVSSGVELPDRVKSPDDIAPLYCCVMAFAAASQPKKEKIYASAYAAGASVVFI
jgi:hypothetical protein